MKEITKFINLDQKHRGLKPPSTLPLKLIFLVLIIGLMYLERIPQ